MLHWYGLLPSPPTDKTSAVSTTACNVADQLLLMLTELTMQNHHGLPDCLLSV